MRRKFKVHHERDTGSSTCPEYAHDDNIHSCSFTAVEPSRKPNSRCTRCENELQHIAPCIFTGRRRSVSSLLADVIKRQPSPTIGSSKRHVDSLLFACVLVRFAETLEVEACQPQRVSYRSTCKASPISIEATQLIVFPSAGNRPIRILEGLTRLTREIPQSVIECLVDWAPPLICFEGRQRVPVVYGNQVSTALVAHLQPRRLLKARVLKEKPVTHFDAYSLAGQLLGTLKPLLNDHRDFIIRESGNPKLAKFLTGVKSSRYFEILKGRDNVKATK